MLNVFVQVPFDVKSGVFTQVVLPGDVVLIRQLVDLQLSPPVVLTATAAVIVAPGWTRTLVAPFSVVVESTSWLASVNVASAVASEL